MFAPWQNKLILQNFILKPEHGSNRPEHVWAKPWVAIKVKHQQTLKQIKYNKIKNKL